MILVDSSVWIDFFSAAPGRSGSALRRMIAEAEPFALTGLVVTEVLQGLWRDVREIKRYLSMRDLLEPRGSSTYQQAARIFRLAREKGITATARDCLIAAIALDYGASVFSLDRGFERVARVTGLPLYRVC